VLTPLAVCKIAAAGILLACVDAWYRTPRLEIDARIRQLELECHELELELEMLEFEEEVERFSRLPEGSLAREHAFQELLERVKPRTDEERRRGLE
jgi:hypothetical protein